MARSLRKLGILRFLPEEFVFSYEDMRDQQGCHLFGKVNKDLIDLSSVVTDDVAHSFWRDMEEVCDTPRLKLFMRKMIADRMHNTVVFLHAVDHQKDSAFCVMTRRIWSNALREYASKIGVRIHFVPSLTHHPLIMQLKKRKSKNKERNERTSPSSSMPSKMPNALVGVWYTGKTLGVEPSKRNEIFWLNSEFINPRDVLLYFERREILPPVLGVASMQKAGVNMVSFYPFSDGMDVPLYQPTAGYQRHCKEWIIKLVGSWIKSWVFFKPVNISIVEWMAWFLRTYVLWSDFFRESGIKINIYGNYINPAHIAINQAMRAQGGVNVVYQWTHVHFHSMALALDTDTFYSFSPAYNTYLEENGSIIKENIPVGYPWDICSDAIKRSASSMRQDLLDHGAKFIVCYLDESSGNDKFAVITHDRARQIYTFWLMRLLEDETLGLIFKPGYIHDFNARIREPLAELFARAQSSGRLKVVGDGHFKTDTLPAEAACAADVTVGLLLSGTALLEAVLTGSKAVFLDLEGLKEEKVYQWGQGAIVFDSCAALWQAMKSYRGDPGSFKQFGDLSRWLGDKTVYLGEPGASRIARHLSGLCANYRKEEHVR